MADEFVTAVNRNRDILKLCQDGLKLINCSNQVDGLYYTLVVLAELLLDYYIQTIRIFIQIHLS